MVKNFLISVLVLILIVLSGIVYFKPTIFLRDSDKAKETSEGLYDYKRESSFMSSLNFYSSSDIISLLSIKYSITGSELIGILSECNKQTQLDYDINSYKISEIQNKMVEEVARLNNNLINIANNHKIQPATLINIIIDYKMLKNQ
jgi:hypothetical protein